MKSKVFFLIIVFVFSNYFASAQGLSMEPNTNIKVLAGTTLKVADGNLLLKSDATGDATVIAIGSVIYGASGKAIVERYLSGGVNAWHMVCAPVNAMAIASSGWAPDADEDFYLWYEPNPGTWVNYKNTSTEPTFETINGSGNFAAGKGYLVSYNTANPTNNFESSALHAGNYSITLDKSNGKSWDWNAGQNLIGNPYPSGLDWSLVNKSGIVTEIYAQVYNANNAGGAGYEPVNGPIASGQGFFVQAESNGAMLVLEPSQQVHTTTPIFMKNAEDKLVLRLTAGQYYDETKILLNGASADEHDFYDATKFFSFEPQVPQLYTLATDGWRLAINSMQAVTETTVIPLSIEVQESGSMNISLTETEGTFVGLDIILHDVLTNTMHKLSDGPYYFLANADDNLDRFLLKFGVVGIHDVPGNSELKAWMQNNLLYVLNPNAPTASIELYNIQGQVILRKEIGQGLQDISVNVATGTYLVIMRTEHAVAMKKLFIQN